MSTEQAPAPKIETDTETPHPFPVGSVVYLRSAPDRLLTVISHNYDTDENEIELVTVSYLDNDGQLQDHSHLPVAALAMRA